VYVYGECWFTLPVRLMPVEIEKFAFFKKAIEWCKDIVYNLHHERGAKKT